MTTPDVATTRAEIKAEFPCFKTLYKKDSWLMKLLGFVMGKTFTASFVTTINGIVYLPTVWDSWSAGVQCAVLRHERVHMRQARRLTYPLFIFLYLLVFFPVGLAWFRTRFEQEAYVTSLAAYKEYGLDYKSPARKATMVAYFTGPAYAYMWPFKRSVESWFDRTVAGLDA
jgi:hypothetical protein